MIADIFAYAATLLNIVMLVPQVVQTWKTKQTKDLSSVTLAMFSVACLLWIIYGVMKSALPVILANTAVISMNLILLYLKFKHQNSKN